MRPANPFCGGNWKYWSERADTNRHSAEARGGPSVSAWRILSLCSNLRSARLCALCRRPPTKIFIFFVTYVPVSSLQLPHTPYRVVSRMQLQSRSRAAL